VDVPDTYNITIDDTHVDVDGQKVALLGGEKVVLTVTPEVSYELATITVTKEKGGTVDVFDNSWFTMPKDNVTVTATFKKAEYTQADRKDRD